jgi:hypothetical protein
MRNAAQIIAKAAAENVNKERLYFESDIFQEHEMGGKKIA